MNKAEITTIIFDLEGVIIDTEIIWDKEQEEFLKRRGLRYEREVIKPQMTGRTIYEGVQVLKKEFGFPGNINTLAKERLDIVKKIILEEVNFIPGFNDFFEKIQNNYKVCVATSMTKELLEIVETKLSLNKLFKDKVYSVSIVGCRSKPFPDIFLYAAEQLRSSPNSCIVIEDSPYGIQAAKKAGMQCIGIATTYNKELLKEADIIVKNYSEISFL